MPLLLGTRKGLMQLEREDGTWRVVSRHFPSAPVSIAYLEADGETMWAALDHGHWGVKLHRSDDRGETWAELEAPKYPEGEEVTEGTPAVLRYIWAMHHGPHNGNGRLFVGTDPGGLFTSDDRGASFRLNRGLWDDPMRKTHWFGGGRDQPGIHSILQDPRDEKHLFVGISCAGVYETTDGGESWEVRNEGLQAEFLSDPSVNVGHDPHLMVMSPSDPDVLWQQNHDGIYRSTDGARSWIKISEEEGPADFGFAVAVDERNPETAWVVPATSDMVRTAVDDALCVCRTDDGGKSWTAFREGLPQKDCFDLAYRHALDVKGDQLAFGTTTGNLYISDDRGESWQTALTTLPLIYSLQIVGEGL